MPVCAFKCRMLFIQKPAKDKKRRVSKKSPPQAKATMNPDVIDDLSTDESQSDDETARDFIKQVRDNVV